MSVETVRYAPTLATAGDTNRGPSQAIWRDCPVESFIQDPRFGTYFFDDFLMSGQFGVTAAGTSLGQWGLFSDAAGVIDVDPQAEGGVLALNNGVTSGVGITMAGASGGFRLLTTSTLALNNKLWFECRVAVRSITTAQRDCFIGLVDNTTANLTSATNSVIAAATNTLATGPNLFGFHFRSTTNPTDVGLAFNVAGGTVQYPTGLQTLALTIGGAALVVGPAVAGFVKLGFLFDPNPSVGTLQISSASSGQTAGNLRKPIIRVFVNGIVGATFLTSDANVAVTTFPTGFMTPAIAFKSRSTTTTDFYIDWIRVAQVALS